ncbi:MAG TPA: sigma factor-like helix-turn-helix DNA-binding protein [Urbifossiella sp.]|nr:sigma factor-like helix-turn-helix DNA-binding protein [Urbifossiella sp.]
MYAALNPTGVSVAEVLAAVEARRQPAEPRAIEWPCAQWERIWTRLSPLQQRVVYLHVFHAYDFQRVADVLGMSRGTVFAAWRRAIERIRDALPAPG